MLLLTPLYWAGLNRFTQFVCLFTPLIYKVGCLFTFTPYVYEPYIPTGLSSMNERWRQRQQWSFSTFCMKVRSFAQVSQEEEKQGCKYDHPTSVNQLKTLQLLLYSRKKIKFCL